MSDAHLERSILAKLSPEVRQAMSRRGLAAWPLEMLGSEQLSPHMRRVHLALRTEAPLAPKAGQDLVFMLPDGTGGLGRRHYTIRRFDAAARSIDVDIFLHGAGATPGMRWARHAAKGETVVAFGPRGRNVVHAGADWRLFVGDDTAVPAIMAMAETLPVGTQAHAILDIASYEDRPPVGELAGVSVDWLERQGAEPRPLNATIIDRVAGWKFPSGRGHAYVLGETSTIRRLRHDLLARGLAKDQIFGEGYWRPGRVGGHDHLEEH